MLEFGRVWHRSAMDVSVIAPLACAEAISIACVVHLWGWKRGHVVGKLAWSLLVLLPLAGPLLYFTVHDAPDRHRHADPTDGPPTTYDPADRHLP
jgi:hypothetical protein